MISITVDEFGKEQTIFGKRNFDEKILKTAGIVKKHIKSDDCVEKLSERQHYRHSTRQSVTQMIQSRQQTLNLPYNPISVLNETKNFQFSSQYLLAHETNQMYSKEPSSQISLQQQIPKQNDDFQHTKISALNQHRKRQQCKELCQNNRHQIFLEIVENLCGNQDREVSLMGRFSGMIHRNFNDNNIGDKKYLLLKQQQQINITGQSIYFSQKQNAPQNIPLINFSLKRVQLIALIEQILSTINSLPQQQNYPISQIISLSLRKYEQCNLQTQLLLTKVIENLILDKINQKSDNNDKNNNKNNDEKKQIGNDLKIFIQETVSQFFNFIMLFNFVMLSWENKNYIMGKYGMKCNRLCVQMAQDQVIGQNQSCVKQFGVKWDGFRKKQFQKVTQQVNDTNELPKINQNKFKKSLDNIRKTVQNNQNQHDPYEIQSILSESQFSQLGQIKYPKQPIKPKQNPSQSRHSDNNKISQLPLRSQFQKVTLMDISPKDDLTYPMLQKQFSQLNVSYQDCEQDQLWKLQAVEEEKRIDQSGNHVLEMGKEYGEFDQIKTQGEKVEKYKSNVNIFVQNNLDKEESQILNTFQQLNQTQTKKPKQPNLDHTQGISSNLQNQTKTLNSKIRLFLTCFKQPYVLKGIFLQCLQQTFSLSQYHSVTNRQQFSVQTLLMDLYGCEKLRKFQSYQKYLIHLYQLYHELMSQMSNSGNLILTNVFNCVRFLVINLMSHYQRQLFLKIEQQYRKSINQGHYHHVREYIRKCDFKLKDAMLKSQKGILLSREKITSYKRLFYSQGNGDKSSNPKKIGSFYRNQAELMKLYDYLNSNDYKPQRYDSKVAQSIYKCILKLMKKEIFHEKVLNRALKKIKKHNNIEDIFSKPYCISNESQLQPLKQYTICILQLTKLFSIVTLLPFYSYANEFQNFIHKNSQLSKSPTILNIFRSIDSTYIYQNKRFNTEFMLNQSQRLNEFGDYYLKIYDQILGFFMKQESQKIKLVSYERKHTFDLHRGSYCIFDGENQRRFYLNIVKEVFFGNQKGQTQFYLNTTFIKNFKNRLNEFRCYENQATGIDTLNRFKKPTKKASQPCHLPKQ